MGMRDRRRPAGGRLRVVHLDHTASPGGAELALVRMLRAQRSWAAVVLLPHGSDGPVYRPLDGYARVRTAGPAQRAGISARGYRAALGPAVSLAAQALAVRTDRAFLSADVIAANTARAAAYGALAARTSRAPFVVHLRDMVTPEALGTVGFLAMTRLALPRADAVIANSRSTLDSAHRYLAPGAITEVIPSASGVRAPAERRPTPSGSTVIGMLARLDPWKGQLELIDAFAQALSHTQARLQLAGDALFGHAEYAEQLRRRVSDLGLVDRVDFLGHVEQVDELLASWDVAVQYATRPEPLGQNVLQYLSAGIATIVADEGGPSEWVSDGVNGLTAPARDPASLATALGRLHDDANLRSALARSAARTPGLMRDEEVARAHGEIYRLALRRR